MFHFSYCSRIRSRPLGSLVMLGPVLPFFIWMSIGVQASGYMAVFIRYYR